MTSGGEIPRARAWRRRIRLARLIRRGRSLGDALGDLYGMLWAALVYGGGGISEARRYLEMSEAAGAPPPERYWVGVAALLVGAGLFWLALKAIGPMLADQAERTWGISTPLDRRDLLFPRFSILLLEGGCVMAISSMAVVALGVRVGPPGVVALARGALAGGTYGVSGAAMAVVAQSARPPARWPELIAPALIGLGGAIAAVTVACHAHGVPLQLPGGHGGWLLSVSGVALAVTAVRAAKRRLARLDVAALGAGAQLASAAVTATVWMDPSVLTGIIETKKWRRVGRVTSRRFLGGRWGRWWVMVQADARRLGRRPVAVGTWAALALAQHAVEVASPLSARWTRIVLCYMAANRLVAGLRTLSRSPGLRRALGGGEVGLRISHLVIPAAGIGLWWAATQPLAAASLEYRDLLLTCGILAAVYRAATPSVAPLEMGVVATPLGLLPPTALHLARGADLLAVLLVAEALFGR